jgi:hypothetical protein
MGLHKNVGMFRGLYFESPFHLGKGDAIWWGIRKGKEG